MIYRGGAEAACWAHNPKVGRSKLPLDNYIFLHYILSRPLWRNWIARTTSNRKVTGSSPVWGDINLKKAILALLAHN